MRLGGEAPTLGRDDGEPGGVIRVTVIAPVPAVRAGLRALLASDARLLVETEGASLGDPRLVRGMVDVILLTEGALSRAGLEQLFQGSEAQVGLLLVGDAPEAARHVVGLPVRGWGLLPLDASAEELTAAVRAVHEGLLVGAPALLGPLLTRPGLLSAEEEAPLSEALTSREGEVLHLLAQGLANKQIAAMLNISEHTVKFHVSSIYAKLGVTNRTEAVSIGARRGLVVL